MRSLTVLMLLLFPLPLFAVDISTEPPDPTSNTRVTLIVTQFDSCPPPPVVTRSGFTISVAMRSGLCLSPPTNIVHRLDLGLLAPGTYDVGVTLNAQPAGSASFVVLDAGESVVVAPFVGSLGGGTEVLVTANVQFCGDQPVTSCGPPTITFGGITASNIRVVDRTHFIATTPEHAAGAVEISVASGSVVKSSYAFRYVDPAAAPLPEVYERVLFPVVYDGPGALGSDWVTELSVRNDNPVAVGIRSGSAKAVTIPSSTPSPLSLDQALGGIFVFVPRDIAGGLHFGARFRDTSRESAGWGSELPVVREEKFTRSSVELLDVPTDRRYRTMVRVYAPVATSTYATVSVYSMADGHLLSDRNVLLQSVKPCQYAMPCTSDRPSFASLGDLTDSLPSADRVAIRVELWNLPVWAFATVTNNDTQHVTVISPQ